MRPAVGVTMTRRIRKPWCRSDGPAWSVPGLNQAHLPLPIGCEAPVLRMVGVLVLGISTLTESALHSALYWALRRLCFYAPVRRRYLPNL